MDRQLTNEEKQHIRRKRIIRLAVPAAIAVAAIAVAVTVTRTGISRESIRLAKADRGDISAAMTTTGKVVPAYEEIIASPISAKIVEVYSRPGDKVEEGTPLLRLDLSAAEAEANGLRDTRDKLILAIEQQRLNNETELRSLEMQIEVKQMSVDRLAAELANEKRLDSIGSGTGDKVREAELALATERLELQHLRRRLSNESRALEAAMATLRLDLSIADRNLAERLRIIDDARIKAPHAATLTFIDTDLGRQVSQGERLATVADLTRLKIDAEIAEGNGHFISPGGDAFVRISNKVFPARVSTVAPVSKQGVISFSLITDSIPEDMLRPGITTEVGVIRSSLSNVIRIPIGSYYSQGAGRYNMYVVGKDGNIYRREVMLGDASSDYVEVRSGIDPGEEVVVSDMSAYGGRKYSLK